MYEFTPLLFVALPWFAGAAVFSRVTCDLGLHPAIQIGAGGYLGYLFIGFIIWTSDTLAWQFYVPVIYRSVLLLLSIVVALHLLQNLRITPFAQLQKEVKGLPRHWAFLILPTATICYVVLSTQAPSSAWDSLDHWGLNASRLIQHHSLGLNTHSLPFLIDFRHPWTVVSINSWAMFFGSEGYLNMRGLPHILIGGSLSLFVFGFCRDLSVSRPLSIVCAYIAFNPLVENHVMLYGYAELWLACAISGSIVLCLIAKRKRSTKIMFWSVVFAISAVSLKNIGYLFVILALAFNFTVFFKEEIGRVIFSRPNFMKFLSLILLITISLMLGALNEQTLSFEKINLDRIYIINIRSITEVSTNLSAALLSNSSFNIIGAVFFVSVFSLKNETTFELQALAYAAAIITGVSLLAVLTIDQIFLYSRPAFDTAFSRLFIPFSQVTALLIGSAISHTNSSKLTLS